MQEISLHHLHVSTNIKCKWRCVIVIEAICDIQKKKKATTIKSNFFHLVSRMSTTTAAIARSCYDDLSRNRWYFSLSSKYSHFIPCDSSYENIKTAEE